MTDNSKKFFGVSNDREGYSYLCNYNCPLQARKYYCRRTRGQGKNYEIDECTALEKYKEDIWIKVRCNAINGALNFILKI